MIDKELEGVLRARNQWWEAAHKQPRLLLSVAEIDAADAGAAAWEALTMATAVGIPQPAMIKELCRLRRMPRVALYRSMNKAMLPALQLDARLLEFLGLHPCETAAELARAVARTMWEAGFTVTPSETALLWRHADLIWQQTSQGS